MDKSLDKSKAVRGFMEATISVNDPPEAKLRKLYERAQQFAYVNLERRRAKQDNGESFRPSKNIDELVKRGYGAATKSICCLSHWLVPRVSEPRRYC